MKDEPEIIKVLRVEEKLGKLHSDHGGNYEELKISERSSDGNTKQKNDFIENDGFDSMTPF